MDIKNKDGGTALMWAAAGGYTQICDLLIKHGADIAAKDKKGMTAVFVAALYGHAKTAQFLKSMESK